MKIGDFDYNVYTNSMIKVVDQMNDIPIKMVNGVPLFLRDVGKAVDSTMIQTNVVRINGNRAVYLPILKQAGANTIAVIDGIKEILPKLINVPKDLAIKLLFDQSLYIRQAIKTLEHEGLLGGGLACLMVLLFLGSLRSTLISRHGDSTLRHGRVHRSLLHRPLGEHHDARRVGIGRRTVGR